VIAALVRIARPAVEPLLKLDTRAPELPEGAATVRRLRPSEGFLGYRYLTVLLASLPQLGGLAALAVVTLVALGPWGLLLVVPMIVVATAIVSAILVATRLDWELRDYLLGDRSLRLRQGAIVQRELTLSYANIQNVEVTQGPIERLFGFKNLKVSTAGGGRAKESQLGGSHDALLLGLVDAESIRDLLLGALKRQRDAGLGDADDAHAAAGGEDAARLVEELREAARALRDAADRSTASTRP
jgi:uncharacterized membrane protein YdbT with pleckstrin-like domain